MSAASHRGEGGIGSAGRRNPASLFVTALIILVGLGLGLAVIREALVHSLGPSAAVALDPQSASALTREAESEQTAGHAAAALALARRAISAQPFNVAALRVVGLVEAAENGPDSADPIMTLAGDWSLRDSQAQAWLFDQRLRHRDYASAFAHADALMREFDAARPPLFKMLAALAKADPRTLGPLARRLATDPPWRAAFFKSLDADPQGQAIAATMAVALAASSHPATNDELSGLFNGLVQSGRYTDAYLVWRRLSVGANTGRQPYDGDFSLPETPQPFGWSIAGGEGATVEVRSNDSGQRALQVEYDGYSTPDFIKTLLVLAPGSHSLSGLLRSDTGTGADRLGWVVTCADTGQVLAEAKGPPTAAPGVWQPFAVSFDVPALGCQGQWLQMASDPGERRTDIVVWYDHLAVTQ